MTARPLLLLPLLGALGACEPRRLVIGGEDTGPAAAEPCPRLHLTSTQLAWDGISTDGAAPQSVTLTNLCSGEGALVLVASLTTESSQAFSFAVGTTTLEPGASTSLVVTFAPDDLDSHSGAVELATNDAQGSTLRISLSGQAVADADGDGHDALGVGGDDCDDTDPATHPEAAEVWADGIDNDCDGTADLLGPDDAVAWLRGNPEDCLGYRGSLAVADLTGDGILDLVTGGWFTAPGSDSQGGVRVLDGTDLDSFAGSIDGYELATVLGAAPDNRVGSLDPRQGDHDGDGVADLYLIGSDVLNADDGNQAGAVYRGGDGLRGQLSTDDAYITLSGCDSLYSLSGLGSLDLDGDGVDELILGDWYSGWSFPGRVYGLMGSSVQSGGDHSLPWSSDFVISGGDNDDRLGCALGGGDLDGDGHDDLLFSAPNADLGDTDSGSVFLITGGATPPGSGEAEDVYRAQIYGDGASERLGWMGRPQVADFDGDGRMDLALSTPSTGTVYLWLDAGALEGVLASSSADVRILGESADRFGLALERGDVDGDGVTDLIVGAPEYESPSEAQEEGGPSGEVSIFTAADLGVAELGSSAATTMIAGVSAADLFGHALAAGDIEGDGRDELLVAGPNAGTGQQGYVWVFAGR